MLSLNPYTSQVNDHDTAADTKYEQRGFPIILPSLKIGEGSSGGQVIS
jgi:hypothetical protein